MKERKQILTAAFRKKRQGIKLYWMAYHRNVKKKAQTTRQINLYLAKN